MNSAAQTLDANPLVSISADLAWLAEVIDVAICAYLEHEGYAGKNALAIVPPDTTPMDDPYARLVMQFELDAADRLVLMLAIAPHFKPEIFDIFLGLNKLHERPFTEFGGIQRDGYAGCLPSVQMACFLLTGNRIEARHGALQRLGRNAPLLAEHIIELGELDEGLPAWRAELRLGQGWADYLFTGEWPANQPTRSFPAQPLTTKLGWEDMVVSEQVALRLNEIQHWLRYKDELWDDWALSQKLKPGYRVLFHGPPGTGKTLAASLLGQTAGRAVFRINLANLVSKYIGETEKNLEQVFRVAQERDWVLFFDEADSLFGKRTETHSSNDRFANQQTGYLLQRVEDYSGLVILATNLRANLDDAFTRRFQQVLYFPMPDEDERLLLWQHALTGKWQLGADLVLEDLARDYEVSGGSINNILQHATLSTIARASDTVLYADVREGIRREYIKDNRTL